MKDEILQLLNMQDILTKYNIKTRNDMYSCPFHKDRTPSAKAYEKSYYCFSCNNSGDLIQFVQTLFNLSFKEAMQKINEDFNLGLHNNTKIDYEKINKIKEERKRKELRNKKLQEQYNEICFKIDKCQKTIDLLNKKIDYLNWENMVYIISKLQDKLGVLEYFVDEIDKEISSR